MRNVHNLLPHCFLKSFFHSPCNHFSFLSVTYPHLPINCLIPSFYKYFPSLTSYFHLSLFSVPFFEYLHRSNFNYSFLPYISTSTNVVPYQCHSFYQFIACYEPASHCHILYTSCRNTVDSMLQKLWMSNRLMEVKSREPIRYSRQYHRIFTQTVESLLFCLKSDKSNECIKHSEQNFHVLQHDSAVHMSLPYPR